MAPWAAFAPESDGVAAQADQTHNSAVGIQQRIGMVAQVRPPGALLYVLIGDTSAILVTKRP